MATFILIHGAWHGGWCWERVAKELALRGHEALCPDLPGMGNDTTPLKDVSLALWADHVAGLASRQAEPVVLVGHSRGGIVISEVAERIPERIAQLVYVAAFLVPHGKTLSEMLALGEAREVAKDAIDMRADGISSTIARDRVGPIFYNTSPPELQAKAALALTPEPMMSFVTPLSLSMSKFGQVERSYVECLQDNAIPIGMQRAMQAALPCKTIVTLDCDHSPFYSKPAELCDALVSLSSNSRHA